MTNFSFYCVLNSALCRRTFPIREFESLNSVTQSSSFGYQINTNNATHAFSSSIVFPAGVTIGEEMNGVVPGSYYTAYFVTSSKYPFRKTNILTVSLYLLAAYYNYRVASTSENRTQCVQHPVQKRKRNDFVLFVHVLQLLASYGTYWHT